ncbi:MAG: hypothetical protein KC516_03405 [Nanoarchaeota archaeon]|nr:hypothetical protein [Nanoarchaeota archaeon]
MVKGQMKIQQTAFMLVALAIFFVLVGLFVVSFSLSSLKKSSQLAEENSALTLVTRLAETPEFSCGSTFGEKRVNCIDSDKLMVLSQNLDSYSDFWGEISGIEVVKLPFEEEIICKSSNYPNCNTFKILSQSSEGIDYSNFVSLCRRELYEGEDYAKCELAKLLVRYQNNEE